ncbi:MAG: uroporphyrinogen-III synthase [Bacillota bacterium]|nr:uroporphyrinogen-III synthase [Bacillota bacterium]
MIQPLPLLEKKILVPRGKKQAKSLSLLIEKHGGIPVEIPLIAFRPIPFGKYLQKVMTSLHTYDWIIFTSNVAVETFLSFFSKKEYSNLPKIAVIGERTKRILNENGLKVRFLPTEYVSETFAEEFSHIVQTNERVLIPKGNLARDVIAETLRKKGVTVEEVIVYETYMPDESRFKLAEMLTNKEIDILMFTSPSTVEHFMGIVAEYKLQSKIEHCLISCIGPVTKEKIESFGLIAHASPEVYTVEEMINSIIKYLN